jgi:flagellin-like protein
MEMFAMRIRLKRLERSKRGVTPVIAIILLLMMTVAAAGAAYLWITKIQKTITTQAEKQIMTSFQQGTLQVISAYACENNCGAGAGCNYTSSDDNDHWDPLDDNNDIPEAYEDNVCAAAGTLCFLVRNTGNTVVRMSDLGSSQVVYELPEAPELGERPMMSRTIGATFSGSGSDVCCRFSEIAVNGKCGDQKSVASRETIILSFFGKFKKSDGSSDRMVYGDVKDQRLIVGLNLPSGFKVSHQVV